MLNNLQRNSTPQSLMFHFTHGIQSIKCKMRLYQVHGFTLETMLALWHITMSSLHGMVIIMLGGKQIFRILWLCNRLKFLFLMKIGEEIRWIMLLSWLVAKSAIGLLMMIHQWKDNGTSSNAMAMDWLDETLLSPNMKKLEILLCVELKSKVTRHTISSQKKRDYTTPKTLSYCRKRMSLWMRSLNIREATETTLPHG